VFKAHKDPTDLRVLKVSMAHKEMVHKARSVHKETEVLKVLKALTDQQARKVLKEEWGRKVRKVQLRSALAAFKGPKALKELLAGFKEQQAVQVQHLLV
jgi:hypothetical protein